MLPRSRHPPHISENFAARVLLQVGSAAVAEEQEQDRARVRQVSLRIISSARITNVGQYESCMVSDTPAGPRAGAELGIGIVNLSTVLVGGA